MSPDSLETRVGVLGERIDQVKQSADARLAEHDRALRRLEAVVADHEVLKDRLANAREDSADYRRTMAQSFADLRQEVQSNRAHSDAELEELSATHEKAERDRASRSRALWLAVVGLVIAFGGTLAAILSVIQAGH